MRLKQRDIDAIKAASLDVFGPNVVLRVFGSRLSDAVRGGDIDLHLEVDEGQQDVAHASRFRWRVYDAIDEQELDLVFHVRGRPLRTIDQVAHAEGVIL